MKKSRKCPGKALETLVSNVEKVLSGSDGVTIESPKILTDRITGEPREHDVCITMKTGHHSVQIALECRDRSRKITVNDVEGFHSKCQDTGIHHGAMVSSKGFTSAALRKAKHHSIRCLTMEFRESLSWLMMPGITSTHRKLLAMGWTFNPTEEILPKPTDFNVLGPDGSVVDTTQMTPALLREFNRIAEERGLSGTGNLSIIFPASGLTVRDNSTGQSYELRNIVARIEYDITVSLIPLSLSTYGCATDGEKLTDVASAEVDLPGGKGQLMIVYNEETGGEIAIVHSGGGSN